MRKSSSLGWRETEERNQLIFRYAFISFGVNKAGTSFTVVFVLLNLLEETSVPMKEFETP